MATVSLITLVANTNENVNDLMSNLNAIVAQVNGNLDATNFATSAKPATLRGAYEMLMSYTCYGAWGGVVAGTYNGLGDGTISAVNVSINKALPIFHFDPADHSISGLTTNLKVRASFHTNGTAPTGNFTFGLYPISAVNGVANNVALGVGTVVSGSTSTVSAPAANTSFNSVSADFAAPAVGPFILGFATSATGAANSAFTMTLQLLKHYT